MLLSFEDGDTSTGTWCNEFWGCFFGSCPSGAHPVLPDGFPHFMGVGLGTVSCAAHAPLLLLWVWQGANEDAAGMRGCGAKPNGLVWYPGWHRAGEAESSSQINVAASHLSREIA